MRTKSFRSLVALLLAALCLFSLASCRSTGKAQEGDDVSEEEILGVWDVTVTLSDVQTPIVGWLRGLFDKLFGEGAGQDIVASDLDQTDTFSVQQTITIEKDGKNLKVTIESEDGSVSEYTGKFKNGALNLTLKAQTGTFSPSIDVPVDKLGLTFRREDDRVVIRGSFPIKTFLLQAEYGASGEKRDGTETD